MDGNKMKMESSNREGRLQDGSGRKEKAMLSKRLCPYCKTGILKPKGACDAAGTVSSKCRKCGRRVRERSVPKPPVPVVPKAYGISGG